MRVFYLLCFLPLLFACNKEKIDNKVELSDFHIISTTNLSVDLAYKLLISGKPQILENGIIFTTNPKPEFFNQRIANTNESSNQKYFTLSKLQAETNYFVQPYVITQKDTILGEILSFKTGEYFKIGSGVTDSDGRLYKTVIIGKQEWMAENLSAIKFSNGDPLNKIDSLVEWQISTLASWCNYGFDSQYDSLYGKMYNGYAVIDSRNVCPSGWHVSTENDWTELILYLGNDDYVGGKLKSSGTIAEQTGNWQYPNAFGTNVSGFNALPGGYLSNNFYEIQKMAEFAKISNGEYSGIAFYYSNGRFDFYNAGMNTGTYIRCVKD